MMSAYPIHNFRRIVIYTTRKCAECIRLKDFLDRKKVFYQEVQMEKVEPTEQLKLKITSVPTVIWNGKRYSGTDIKEIYGKN